jgi:hypothetical protein
MASLSKKYVRPQRAICMRATILSSLIVAFLLAGPVHAAPICQTRDGVPTRCGAEGAMPMDWIAPERPPADPLGGNGAALLNVALGLGLFLAFIALLPPFDGSKDWDRQESDDD